MRSSPGLVVLALVLTGCPGSKRKLPADPPDMKRVEGTKLTVPQPEGYEVLTGGASSVEDLSKRGGVSLVRSREGEATTSIVVDLGQTPTGTWSHSECQKLSEDVAKLQNATARGAEVLELPTGSSCHFLTDAKDQSATELFYVAGGLPYIVACRGQAHDLPAHCKYVASWIRPKA